MKKVNILIVIITFLFFFFINYGPIIGFIHNTLYPSNNGYYSFVPNDGSFEINNSVFIWHTNFYSPSFSHSNSISCLNYNICETPAVFYLPVLIIDIIFSLIFSPILIFIFKKFKKRKEQSSSNLSM